MEECDVCDCDPFEYLQWQDHDADVAMLEKLMTKEVCGYVECIYEAFQCEELDMNVQAILAEEYPSVPARPTLVEAKIVKPVVKSVEAIEPVCSRVLRSSKKS